MKKLLYLFLLFLPVLGSTQSRYGVEGVPVCWRTPLGVDSSLNRYVLVSTTGKPVQTIVYENANGVVVNVSGGSMRYGYCDCIDFTVPDSSVTWEMLTQPVKDSIKHKRDTFITVPPSTNYFQNNIDNPAKFYNNIYLSCKGRTDTSIVVFLAAPVFEEQKGVVYHIKNDSGLVAAFVINYAHLSNNKRFYLLKRGQTAQVRLLPDAANGGNYGWAVNVVWDSIGGDGNGIISALPLGNVNINANDNSLIFKKLRSLKLKTTTGKTAMAIDTFSNGLFFSLNKTVSGTNLGSLLYFRDTTGVKDNAFYFGQIDYSFSQNSGSGHQMIFGMNGDKVVGGDKSYFGVRNDTTGAVPIVRIMYGDRYSNATTPDMHHFRGAVPNITSAYTAPFRIETSSARGKLSADIDGSLFVRENGKVYIGSDSSFIHDPAVDSTKINGYLAVGKPSSLGSPTTSGHPFVFRNPAVASTYLLIESGRTEPANGSAGIRLLPTGLNGGGIDFGTATSSNLGFYSYYAGKNLFQIGITGYVSGNKNSVLVGGIVDPIQWDYNTRFVIYDTITSGKGLFVAKKVASSVTPIAVFSSASNDRMTIEDDGDVKIGTGSASAKLHVIGDCLIESTIWLNVTKTVGIFSGTGSPEGVITASIGSTFHRTNGGAGTSFYVKESGSGNTGWIAK